MNARVNENGIIEKQLPNGQWEQARCVLFMEKGRYPIDCCIKCAKCSQEEQFLQEKSGAIHKRNVILVACQGTVVAYSTADPEIIIPTREQQLGVLSQ